MKKITIVLKKEEYLPIICKKLKIDYDKVEDVIIGTLLGGDDITIKYKE